MDKSALVAMALQSVKQAYAPYSHFQVGAALLCEDGTVFTGANVENASYPAGCCAERAAVFQAVSKGYRKFAAIAVCGGLNGVIDDYCAPCGICRQVLREFADPGQFLVILGKTPEDYREYTLEELLPESFGPEYLERR